MQIISARIPECVHSQKVLVVCFVATDSGHDRLSGRDRLSGCDRLSGREIVGS